MVFLTKIRNLIKQYKNRGFRNSIEIEKNRKYLFREEKKDIDRGRWRFFKRTGERISPIARFFQDKIQISDDFKKKQEYVLRSIGILLIGLSTYIFFYSPYFELSPSKVLIEGLDDGIDISLAYRSIENLYGKNIFFLDEKNIAISLRRYQKNISSITIDRLYPNSIKILLSGYPVLFDITISTLYQKQWGMTQNGVVIPRDALETTPLYTLEYIDSSLTNDDLIEYKNLISENDTQIIIKSIDAFRLSHPDLPIKKVLYLKKENELHLLLENGIKIFLTLQDFTKKSGELKTYSHIRSQLIGLQAFIEKNKESFLSNAYFYVDARIPGKIFSCKDAVICKQNINTVYPDLKE